MTQSTVTPYTGLRLGALCGEPLAPAGVAALERYAQAVGLAFPDVLQCRGMYQVKTGPGHTPGCYCLQLDTDGGTVVVARLPGGGAA